MWVYYNHDSGEYLGTTWGSIEDAKGGFNRVQVAQDLFARALTAPLSTGGLAPIEELALVEIEEADCHHRERVEDMAWRESARQTHWSPAEHVSSCRACAKARWRAQEAVEDALDAAIDALRERRRA